jgi:hypothetical protein
MFYKHLGIGKLAILIVYVDDIILTHADVKEIKALREWIATKFEIKDLGLVKYFLGIEFARSKEEIFIKQWKYVLDALSETGMLGCKAAETPIEPNKKLQVTDTADGVDRE